MLDFSSNELDLFSYLLRLSNHCKFVKRGIIYNNIILVVSESSRNILMDRKCFNLLIIMWHYLDQTYLRRTDKGIYNYLDLYYKIERKNIRTFGEYYKLNFKVKRIELLLNLLLYTYITYI